MEFTVDYAGLAVNIVICGLAVFRYTMLLYNENGPWDVFDWLRFKAGISIVETLDMHTQEVVKTERKGEGFFAKLLNCPYCISGWISIALAPAVVLPLIFDTYQVLPFVVWLPFEFAALVGATWGMAYLLFKGLEVSK